MLLSSIIYMFELKPGHYPLFLYSLRHTDTISEASVKYIYSPLLLPLLGFETFFSLTDVGPTIWAMVPSVALFFAIFPSMPCPILHSFFMPQLYELNYSVFY